MVYDIANNKDIACKKGFIAETLNANAIKFTPYIFKSSTYYSLGNVIQLIHSWLSSSHWHPTLFNG